MRNPGMVGWREQEAEAGLVKKVARSWGADIQLRA
jgi:hypothetical protein